MIRGVSFRVPDGLVGKYLLQDILDGIDVEQYCWHSIPSQFEDCTLDEADTEFFAEDYYTGKDLSEHVQVPHYILFIKLQAYFLDGHFFHIHTYEEFQESDCQLLLLVCDCTFIDIYIKDQDVLKTMYDNALAQGYERVTYLTETNDGRTGMDLR